MQVNKSIKQLRTDIESIEKEIKWLDEQIEEHKRYSFRASGSKFYGSAPKTPRGLIPQFVAMKNQRQELIKEYENSIEAAYERVKITVDERDNSAPTVKPVQKSVTGLFKAYITDEELDY